MKIEPGKTYRCGEKLYRVAAIDDMLENVVSINGPLVIVYRPTFPGRKVCFPLADFEALVDAEYHDPLSAIGIW